MRDRRRCLDGYTNNPLGETDVSSLRDNGIIVLTRGKLEKNILEGEVREDLSEKNWPRWHF